MTVGVITYKRPVGLARLLDSLASLEFRREPETRVFVVVVDNDPQQSAAMVCNVAVDRGLRLDYLVESARGIPYARNAVLRHAGDGVDFIAFIDDDEVASPFWLDELLAVALRYRADVVQGPVLPDFLEPPPRWVREGRFFEMPRHATGSRLRHASTDNVLMATSFLRQVGTRFDPRFAMTGGSDTHFFMILAARGAAMVWADDAIVREMVPPTRARAGWIVRRSFREGSVIARCERLVAPSAKQVAIRVLKGVARMGEGLVLVAVGWIAGRHHFARGFQHIARGVGSIVGLVGVPYKEYERVHGT